MTTHKKLHASIQRCRKMSILDADVHVWVGGGVESRQSLHQVL